MIITIFGRTGLKMTRNIERTTFVMFIRIWNNDHLDDYHKYHHIYQDWHNNNFDHNDDYHNFHHIYQDWHNYNFDHNADNRDYHNN